MTDYKMKVVLGSQRKFIIQPVIVGDVIDGKVEYAYVFDSVGEFDAYLVTMKWRIDVPHDPHESMVEIAHYMTHEQALECAKRLAQLEQTYCLLHMDFPTEPEEILHDLSCN